MSLAPGITAALADIVGPAHVTPGCEAYLGRDMSVDAMVVPGTSMEVAQIVRGAVACDLTVLTADGTVFRDADRGQIVLNLARLNQVVEIDRMSLRARVQPNIARRRLLSEIASAGVDVARIHCGRSSAATDHLLSVEAVSRSGRRARPVIPTPAPRTWWRC